MKEYTVACLAALVMCVVIAAPVGCTINRDNVHTKAIASSSNPIATSCALEPTDINGRPKAICFGIGHGK